MTDMKQEHETNPKQDKTLHIQRQYCTSMETFMNQSFSDSI